MLCIPKLITRSLPYGHFITRILKYFCVLIDEPSCRPSKSIGDEAVSSLGFEWQNGTWVNSLKINSPFLLQVMIDHLMLWFQPINYLFFRFPFGVSVDVEILLCLPLLLQPLHLLCNLPSLQLMKRLLFNSLWMR